MSRKLTKQEQDFLNALCDDKELMAKGFIRRFIIRNTYEPKYKVGDYVKVTDDTCSYIWGNRVVGVNAKIVEINWLIGSGIDKGKECVQYECIAYDQFGNDHYVVAEESIYGNYEKRHIDCLSDTDQNTFEKKSKASDSISL